MEEGRGLLSWIIIIAIPSLIAIGIFLFIFLVTNAHLQKNTNEALFIFGYCFYMGIPDPDIIVELLLPRISEVVQDVMFLNLRNLLILAAIIFGAAYFMFYFFTPLPWMIRKRLEKKPPSPPD